MLIHIYAQSSRRCSSLDSHHRLSGAIVVGTDVTQCPPKGRSGQLDNITLHARLDLHCSSTYAT